MKIESEGVSSMSFEDNNYVARHRYGTLQSLGRNKEVSEQGRKEKGTKEKKYD